MFSKMTVIKMKKVSELAQPLRSAYEYAAGVDIAAVRVAKEYNGTKLLGTGWALEIPTTHYVEIHVRSSTHKDGFSLANTVGVVDSDYRGEIFLAMNPTTTHIQVGDRCVPTLSSDTCSLTLERKQADLPSLPWYCVQLIPKKKEFVQWVEVEELSDTQRGEGGFGSSNVPKATPEEKQVLQDDLPRDMEDLLDQVLVPERKERTTRFSTWKSIYG